MKRYVLIAIILVGLISVGFAARIAMAVDATSSVTVTVQEYIAIAPTPLPAMTITVITPGTPATGTSDFNVNANVATTITVPLDSIVQPTELTGLSGSVNPTTGSPGSTPIVLTGTITVPLDKTPGDYTGGSITVTVTKT